MQFRNIRVSAGRLLALAGIVLLLAVLAVVRRNAFDFRSAEQTHPPAGEFIEVDGTRLHYVERGSGPPVVLLHGNPGTLVDLAPLVDSMSGTVRVIAFDRPGHGYSDRGVASAATPSRQADLIHGALEQLGAERPVIVGHSWGGALALTYALRHPEQVAGLVLIGPRAFRIGSSDPLYRALRAPFVGELMRWTVLPWVGRGMVESGLHRSFAPDSVRERQLATARALWLRPGQSKATVWDTRLLEEELIAQAPRYGTVDVPVIVLVGDNDDQIEEAVPLSQALPDAELRVLPATGHQLQITRASEVVAAVRALQSMERGAE